MIGLFRNRRRQAAPADPVEEVARSADFSEAFRLWHLAALAEERPSVKAEHIMRASRARQMADDWRAEAGHWEWLGNTLGRLADAAELSSDGRARTPDQVERLLLNRYGSPDAREGFAPFYVMSDADWKRPLDDDYENDLDLARHRQASAYQWAGERAAAAGQPDEAARLYRRAGISWERSEHPENHHRAADCYYRAALSASESLRFHTRRRLFEGWCASCLRDKTRERECGARDQHEPLDGEYGNEGDVGRLISCWSRVLGEAAPAARPALFREAERQMSYLQHTLASHGARSEALRIYRLRMDFRLRALGRTRSWRWPFVALHRSVSFYSSRVKQALVTLLVVYGAVLPVLWRFSDRVAVAGPHGPQVTRSWAEAVVFSMGNVINSSTGHFAAGDTVTTLLQTLQALSAYFALGYLLWIAQRSYGS